MKAAKRILSLLMGVVFILSALPAAVFAADETVFILSESFNGAPTNGMPETVTVTGAKSRVLEVEGNNKLLQILAGERATVKAPFSATAEQYVIDFELSGDSKISATIAMDTENSSTPLFSISENTLLTKEGKEVGGINSNAFSRITIAVDQKTGCYSIYINDKLKLADWKLPSNSKFTGFSIIREIAMSESLYIENLFVYEGKEPASTLPQGIYSPEGEEFMDYTDDLGDFSFFKSDYITHRYVAYPNTTITPKTNEIECEKFDYKNPNKGDRIIFRKQTEEDCYIDVTAKIFTTYRSEKQYQYFKLSGNFMCDFEGDGSLYIFQLRDTQSTGSQINVYPIQVNTADGSIKLYNGKIVTGAAAKGKWFNITMYLNLKEHKVTMFIDDEKVLEDEPLSESLQILNMTRIQCRSGAYTGELQSRGIEFTGLDKPYEGEEIRTSMFGDDQEIKEYLADKTCFHYYGERVWANGEKFEMSVEPEYEGGEMYVGQKDFDRAYGVESTAEGNKLRIGEKEAELEKGIREKDGEKLVPVKEAAEKLLGENVFDDTNGMMMTSQNKIYFDAEKEVPYHKRKIDTGYIDRFSTLQYIYDFILFDRPSREELKEGFDAATDNGAKHPRLLADKEDFARIKRLSEADEYMKMVVEDLIGQADKACEEEPISFVYQDDLRTTTVADRLKSRMLLMGLAYQLTGEQKYVDGAWKNLNALNGFPDINPGHPIDTGSYGVGMAIGYDWMYEGFTEEQRKNISENAKRLHLNVITDGFYGRSPVRGGPDGNINVIGYYNKWISNYNMWTNSGSLMMALAFMEDYPEQCTDLLWHSIRSLEYTFKNLYPDGTWVESSSYWGIVARGMADVYGTLQGIYGTDFNLSKFPGTEMTGITHMTLRGMVSNYNYHDAGAETVYASLPMSFLGIYFDQPELLAARYATLTRAFEGMPDAKVEVCDALCYDPNVKIEQIKELPRVNVARGLESFAVHEDYTEYDGLFLAAHGGPTTFYHSHNDVGDFVFDLNGQRWAMALPAEDYNSTLAGSERYRMRTEGHNTVSINNSTTFNQAGNRYSPIIKWEEGEGGAYAVYDMSELYNDVDKYLRGFYVGDNYRSVTIRDEIDLNKANSEIYWFMHTQAEAEVMDEKTVILTTGGESVTLNFEAEAETAKVEIMDAVPLATSPQGEGQNPNAGVRKVAIRLTGSDKVTLTVRIGEFAGVVDQTPIEQWSAPGVAAAAMPALADESTGTAEKSETAMDGKNQVLRYGKEKSGKVAAGTMELDFSALLQDAENYDLAFDLLPNLQTGSFNFYLGGYFQLVYAEKGRYTLRFREEDDADFTALETLDIDDFVPVRLEVRDNERVDLYIGGRCVKRDTKARDGYGFKKFGIVLNNAMKGYTYYDNFSLTLKNGDSAVLDCERQGDSLQIEVLSVPEAEIPRLFVAFYTKDGFEHAVNREVSAKTEIPIPETAVLAKIMLWDKNMMPLSDAVRISLE